MAKLLWNKAEIRNELYIIWNQIQELQNAHLSRWTGSGVRHEPSSCDFCARFEAQKQGLMQAVRHFGGKPRR